MRSAGRLGQLAVAAILLWSAAGYGSGEIQGARMVRRYNPNTGNRPQQLDRNTYVSTRNAGVAFLRKFSPRTHYFLGIGRSPARVIAFLKSLSMESAPQNGDVSPLASQVPATGMQQAPTADRYPEFYRHFEFFLPEDVKAGKRAVVLLDHVMNGFSMRNFAVVLQSYFAAKGVAPRIILSGLWRQQPIAGFDALPTASYPNAMSSDMPEADFVEHHIGLQKGRLEDLSKKRSNAYLPFRSDLDIYIAHDAELDGIVQAEFSDLLPEAEGAEEPAPARPRRAASGKIGAAGYQLEHDGAVHTGVLKTRQYAALRDAALELLRVHSPKQSVYLGLGRSSSAMVAVLDNLGMAANYLPIDGLKKDADKLASLAPDFAQIFAATFADARVRGKTIVLFQATETGASLPLAAEALTSYLASRGLNSEVAVVALTVNPETEDDETVALGEEAAPLFDEVAKAISVRDYYRVGKGNLQELRAPVRPEYTQFKQYLSQLMSADEQLAGHNQ